MSNPVIAQLIERLANPDYATRKKAVEHLTELGQAAVPRLRDALQSTSILTQTRAVEALGRIGASEAIPDLMVLLENDPREEILMEIIGALERISSLHYHPDVQIRIESAKRTYAARLQQNTHFSQSPYYNLLSWDELRQQYRSREQLTARLPKQLPTGEATFHRALPSDIDALIARLRDPDYSMGKAVVARLIALGVPAVQPLLEVLSLPVSLPRQRAIRALGSLDDPRAVEPLLKLYQETLAIEVVDLLEPLQDALLALSRSLAARATPALIPPLVALVRELRVVIPKAAVAAAQGLLQLAQTHPTPELRQALPALKGSFFQPVPAEFHAIRNAIEQATAQWKDLPLMAEAPSDAPDLPLPAAETNDGA